ncbi:MAG TPA: MoaF N-terminal domain-containing protein [Gemmatimonadaceae bacterium]
MNPEPELSLAGRTLRWRFSDGPTANKTYEHTFNADGTVVYREVSAPSEAGQSTAGKGDEKKADGAAKTKTPIRYASYQVSPGVHFVSYLAPDSGYTLTVLADTNARVVYAIASSSKEWYPLKGKLEPTG